ncbi:chain-length determining protein [Candidatus Ferrigenium straubiae]|jgi:capsular polysaccharide transport system permease protein|uniref:chain-length determining protein n=1 Tax=Candidatus Ferrigenium straubiae TaxID=2919506 RepID=UPI003F4AB169
MINHLKSGRFAQAAVWLAGWIRGRLAPALLRNRAFGAAFLASLAAAFYWGIVASDRYVSEAHVVIQRTDLAGGQAMDFAGPFGNLGSGRADQLLLRDYLLSIDMLKKLDARLNLRGHYSGWYRDPLSRMWFEDAPLELFHRHFLSMTSVEFDDYAGVLVIKAQGYDPQMAHALAAMLVEEGEHYMNAMAHDLARDQVAFLEKQAGDMSARTLRTRREVLDYQNRKGLVSPQGTVENLAAIIGRLEAQLADLQTRRTGMLGYLMPDSPNIAELNLQIGAIEKQIRQEQARLVSPNGKMLNSVVEEFQRLQMNADFAQDVYKTALVALEKGRIEATRTLKKVSVLQAPTEPQYPLEPRRLYNTVVFTLIALLLAGVVQLLDAIIRDHKD